MSSSAIIGDIHGCPSTLLDLLNQLPDDIDTIYSVGDLVDRGPNSREVVQICIDNNIKAVRGNHEDMLLDYLNKTGFYDHNFYESNGGAITLGSYWIDKLEHSDHSILTSHKDYLESLPYYIEEDEFILSHAGIHPVYSTGEFGFGIWNDNSERCNTSLMWNRESIDYMGKLQIFGHTPVPCVTPIKTKKNKIKGINIDTGCGKSVDAKLAALIFPSMNTISVNNSDLTNEKE